MAILGSLEASVSINGHKALEYDDPDNNDPTTVVSKYIEVVAGANFSLGLTVKNDVPVDCDCLSWTISLDGDSMVSHRIHFEKEQKRLEAGYDVVKVVNGITVENREGSSLSKFKFGDLAISDDHNLPLSSVPKQRVKYLGTVSIRVFRCKKGAAYVPKPDSNGRGALDDSQKDPMPEKALKGRAITLSAGLDDPIPDTKLYKKASATGTKHKYTKLNDGLAIAVFNFKYRSRKALHDEWIIPRSPTPEPLDARSVEELSVEELRELVRLQKEKQVEAEKAKKEIKEEGTPGRKRQRSESNTTPVRANKVVHIEEDIEVVDLAGESNDETAALTTAATSFASG